MMSVGLFLVVGILIVAAAYIVAPTGWVVHASRTKEMTFRRRRFPMAGLYRDPDGNRILRDDRMLGRVSGDSCLEVGIRDGDVVVARKMSDWVWKSVAAGDVVVINSPVGHETEPMRLRIVKKRSGSTLTFCDDAHGTLEPKDRQYVAGKVEFAGSF